MPAYRRSATSPTTSTSRSSPCPPRRSQDVVLDCAAKGVHGLVVVSAGFAETGEEGRKRQRRLVGLSRSYGLRLIGPNALGMINTAAESRMNASLSPVMPAARPGRLLLPVRRAGHGDPGEGPPSRAGPVDLRQRRQPRRRLGQRPAAVLGGGRRPPRSCCSTWSPSATHASSPGSPAGSRGASRSSRCARAVPPRACRWATPYASSSAPGAAVDAMFRQAGVIQVDTLDEMFDVAQLVAHQPLPRGNRVAIVGNSDALGAAGRGRRRLRRVWRSPARASSAPTPHAEDFEDALDAAIDDPEVDSVVAVYIPPLNTPGDEVADVLAAVGEQSDKPLVSTFLGTEGVPELLRVPDVGRRHRPGAGRCRRTPRWSRRCARSPRSSSYARWLEQPEAELDPAEEEAVTGIDARGARRFVTQLLMDHPGGKDLDPTELGELLGCLRRRAVGQPRGHLRGRGRRRGERLGWDVVLKATAEHLRQRPDTGARLAQHRRRRGDGATRGGAGGHPGEPRPAGVRRAARRARRSACVDAPAWRTRCSARCSPSASPARSPSCWGTGSTGSRR